MATRTNRVEVEITATDEASPKIDRLEKKIDGLESDEARIVVTANTERLEKQLTDAKTKLEGLDGDHATVQLRAIGTLEQDLEDARRLLTRLDGQTGTVRISARDTATADIKDVRDELRKLDGDTADVGTGRLSGRGLAAGVGLAALPAALLAGANEAANMALQVQTLADLTGATLEDTSRLVGVFGQSGVEASDLADIILQVNQTMRDNPELAEQLGVTIEDNTDLISTFLQAVQGVGTAYDDAGDRAAAASTLFGEEGVRQVGLVTSSVGDLQAAIDEFGGPIVSDESVENAKEINREITEVKQQWQEISLIMLPIISGTLGAVAAYFDAVGDAGERFGNWMRDHPRLSGGELLDFLGGADESGGLVNNLPGFINRTPSGPPSTRQGPIITIINPPGTPAATANNLDTFTARNGNR